MKLSTYNFYFFGNSQTQNGQVSARQSPSHKTRVKVYIFGYLRYWYYDIWRFHEFVLKMLEIMTLLKKLYFFQYKVKKQESIQITTLWAFKLCRMFLAGGVIYVDYQTTTYFKCKIQEKQENMALWNTAKWVLKMYGN